MLGVQRRQPHVVAAHPAVRDAVMVRRPLAEIQRLLPRSGLVLVVILEGPGHVRQVPVMRQDTRRVKGQVWGGRAGGISARERRR